MTFKLKVLSAVCAFAVGGAAYMTAIAADTVETRTKPVGEVCMAGEACAAAVSASAGGGEPRTGEAVHSKSCGTCHATGAAGAPKTGEAGQWQPRLAERGVDGLYKSAISGFKAMPAKGLCMDCSDEELHNAVNYMLTQSGIEI